MNLFIKIAITFLIIHASLANSEVYFSKDNRVVTSLKLQDLKEKFEVHKVTVFNPYTLKPEVYNAFSMRDILQKVYQDSWKDQFALTVTTKDKYSPIIETYKFEERQAYLAFSRADNKKFVSLTMYKEKIVDLSPFYLIWKEDKTKVPSRRKTHWPYKVTGFDLTNDKVEYLIPSKENKQLTWGYQNVRKNCLSCHTVHGYGSNKVSEIISTGMTKRMNDKTLAKFIHKPRSINPKSKMPRFSPKIDNRTDRIKNIILYLRYLENIKKRKRETSTKKLLKVIHGDGN